MRAFVDKMLAQLREYFGKMESKRKRTLIILSLLVVVFAIITVILLSQTNYIPLYTARNADEARQIYNILQGEDIPARIEGTQVLVPENNVGAATRAVQGMISPDRLNHDILGEAAGFSVTDTHANRLADVQVAEWLTTQILQSPKIDNALVTVTTGDRSAFRSANVRPSSASVMLKLIDGQLLSQQEAQGIADLVRGNMPGILYENIHIIDDRLNSYKTGELDMDIDMVVNSRIALTNILEKQMQTSAEQLLAPVFLLKNIQVTPTVRLNFDKIEERIIEFAPPVAGELDGIVRSSSELYEWQRYLADAEGIPGTDTNNMGMGEYPFGTFEDGELFRKALIEKNYEINETLRIIEREEGKVDFLSITVLLNSDAVVLVDDYTEEAVIRMVQTGLGISPANITVATMSFAEDTSMQDAFDAWTAHDEEMRQRELIQTIIMWSVILLLGILLFSLIRTIIKGAQPQPEPVLADAVGVDYIVDDDDDLLAELATIEREEIELQKKQSELEDIEKFIDKDPGAVAQLLRNWLMDD